MTDMTDNPNETTPASTNAPAQAEDPRHTPLIDARLTDLTARFGDRFNDEQRTQVRSRIGRTVALSDSLRKLPLTNADEPEIVFVPYRGND